MKSEQSKPRPMAAVKSYRGFRVDGACHIARTDNVGNESLVRHKASQKIRNHSPDGFEWGYNGSGPAQAALAILLDLYGPKEAQRLYQSFKFDVVAAMPNQSDWELTVQEIEMWKKGDSVFETRKYFRRKWDGGMEEERR